MQTVPHSSGPPSPQHVEFMGTTLADAKRKALNYWYLNQKRLQLSVREFSERLVLMGDGRTILYAPKPTR
jgi:hypothetical protein